MRDEPVRPDDIKSPHIRQGLEPLFQPVTEAGFVVGHVRSSREGIADPHKREVDGLEGPIGLLGQHMSQVPGVLFAAPCRLSVALEELQATQQHDAEREYHGWNERKRRSDRSRPHAMDLSRLRRDDNIRCF